jgi:hypothetical protein
VANVDALLRDDEPAPKKNIDALLSDDEPAQAAPAKPERPLTDADRQAVKDYFKPRELPWYERAAQGLVDPVVGLGQIAQNVIPDRVLNAGRAVTDPIINTVAKLAGGESIDTTDTSTAEFNKGVDSREGAYEAQREEAGQEGVDWWRIGGTLANPLSWVGPAKAATGLLGAVRAGAQAGLFQALLQPVTGEGNFLVDKGIQGTLGAAFGGTLGAAFAGFKPLLAQGRQVLGKAFSRADSQAQTAAATQVTDDAFRVAGIDPARADPRAVNAMREEVLDAYRAGVDPDPVVMTNRADAAALPIPMKLLRGEASGDPALHSWEINTAKRSGVGDEILQHKDTNNRLLIENLNELGAKSAPSTFDASAQVIAKVEALDAQLSSQIDTAYQAVRDSAGRPALMDHQKFLQEARAGLSREQVEEFVPAEIRATINALEIGNTPLTVNTAQQLDKVWGRSQRSAQDGNVKVAIGELRKALNAAPVSDTLGQDSMQAYQTARALAKQRFDLIDANPAYKAVIEGGKNAEPDNFWKSFVAGAPASQIASLKTLVGPDVVKTIQDTTVRQLKKRAIGSASDERADFSQAAYNSMIHDDVMGPRLREIFREDPERLGQLYRVGRVAESIKKFTPNHRVNTSGTAAEAENIVAEHVKGAAGQGLLGLLGGPGRFLGGVINSSREANERAAERLAVKQSLSPGVTRAPLPPAPPPKSLGRLSDLLSRGAGAAVPQDEE